jgi:hypothetical protein
MDIYTRPTYQSLYINFTVVIANSRLIILHRNTPNITGDRPVTQQTQANQADLRFNMQYVDGAICRQIYKRKNKFK